VLHYIAGLPSLEVLHIDSSSVIDWRAMPLLPSVWHLTLGRNFGNFFSANVFAKLPRLKIFCIPLSQVGSPTLEGMVPAGVTLDTWDDY
jgi:hypothetical protein